MPLINLRTNLKTTSEYTSTEPNLSYGHDQRGGGSSDQPFIVTNIPAGNDLYPIAGPDFILRNGYLNYAVNTKDDVLRLGKWFFGGFKFKSEYWDKIEQKADALDWQNFGSITEFVKAVGGNTVRGLKFTAKQTLLERQNVKVENGFGRLYNPLNTIIQAGTVSSGYHINKQDLNPFKKSYLQGEGNNEGYFNITKTDNATQVNRLIGLLKFKKYQELSSNYQKYGLSNDPNTLYTYSGGPGSFLGIGSTFIKVAKGSTTFLNPNYNGFGSTITYANNTDSSKSNYLKPTGVTPTFIYTRPFDGYMPSNNLGSINSYRTSQTSFNRKRNGTTQIMNPNLSISPDNDFDFGEDIIDFQFQLINNNGNSADPTILNFRAFVEDFSDGFTGDWDTYRYAGRGENFYRYKGFSRDMSITFTVPNMSRADVINNYQKLNALIWSTTPDYSDDGLMRGSLMKFTMGNYLKDAIIIVKSVTLTPIMEMGFDINRAEDGNRFELGDDLYTGQLPKGMRVQCNITPLTQGVADATTGNNLYYIPQRGEPFVGNTRHIIADRDSIITRYSLKGADSTPLDPIFTPNNPVDSQLMKK